MQKELIKGPADAEPLVSIIMPLFNAERFLVQSINSVLNQEYRNWELIIVDDFSCDTSAGIAEKFASSHERVRVFKLGKNSGCPAVPRNAGIRRARGEYIAFLDADDLWLPEKLSLQVGYMEKHCDIFLVYGKCLTNAGGKLLKNAVPNKLRNGAISRHLYMQNFIPIPTVMIRNTIAGKEYFFNEDPSLRAIEDYFLWMEISLREKIGFLNETLAIYRIHRGNTSKGALAFFRKNMFFARSFRDSVPKRIFVVKVISLLIILITTPARKAVRMLFKSQEANLKP